MLDEKKYQDWQDLVLYTKEFKEWIWKLFRKVHARIGHVEEELAKVRKIQNVDYRIEEVETPSPNVTVYNLMEKNSNTLHGQIVVNKAGGGGSKVIIIDEYED